MAGKRSYTVPILYLALTIMAILLVLSYSKQLLTQQELTLKDGKRLASQYDYALIFADRLHDGAELLLQGNSSADMLKAAVRVGEADAVKAEAGGIFAAALDRGGSSADGESPHDRIEAALAALFDESGGAAIGLAEQEAPYSADQIERLQAVKDASAAMREALSRFRPPTVDAGYRSMAAGVDWVDAAASAAQSLLSLASELR